MSLASFKTIYWWEWAHRELGRFIGLVYIAGFFWFVGRRGVPLRTAVVLAGMGLLLGAQGVVGWIMVASGLEPGMTAVAPIRLALHLMLAALFFAALVATYVRLGGAPSEATTPGERFAARALVVLAFIQIALGGLVAGHDAGLTYNTWPLMDGRIIPKGLGAAHPFWRNVFDNVVAIQFNHRIGAYVLAAAILAYAVAMRRADVPARGRAILLGVLILGADRRWHPDACGGGSNRLGADAPGDGADPAFCFGLERGSASPCLVLRRDQSGVRIEADDAIHGHAVSGDLCAAARHETQRQRIDPMLDVRARARPAARACRPPAPARRLARRSARNPPRRGRNAQSRRGCGRPRQALVHACRGRERVEAGKGGC